MSAEEAGTAPPGPSAARWPSLLLAALAGAWVLWWVLPIARDAAGPFPHDLCVPIRAARAWQLGLLHTGRIHDVDVDCGSTGPFLYPTWVAALWSMAWGHRTVAELRALVPGLVAWVEAAALAVWVLRYRVRPTPWGLLAVGLVVVLLQRALAGSAVHGNLDPVVHLAVATALLATRGGRPFLGGLACGLATALKVFPFALVLLAPRTRDEARSFLAGTVAAVVASATLDLVLGGPLPFTGVRYGFEQALVSNGTSLVELALAHELFDVPTAFAVWAATGVLLGGWWIWLRRRIGASDLTEILGLIALVALLPRSRIYYLALAAGPAVALLAERPAARVVAVGLLLIMGTRDPSYAATWGVLMALLVTGLADGTWRALRSSGT
ncbi:MAG: DUF2029 domain-containing protein [Alphaproteobacteria bacterium]|nr:DUF2029 domain-containing protein [Alphaproteobacteria bacterium]